jgi:hypothetical protein
MKNIQQMKTQGKSENEPPLTYLHRLSGGPLIVGRKSAGSGSLLTTEPYAARGDRQARYLNQCDSEV